MTAAPARLRRLLTRLRGDTSGLALLEFAFSLPLVLGIGLYGIELANLALAHLRISQVALNLADNASRLGVRNSNNTTQMREIDVDDLFAAVRIQGKPLDLTTRGRVVLSSLEERGGKQVIHWQRCLGKKTGADYSSHYGITTATDGIDTKPDNDGTIVTGGMGPTGGKVTAPADSGVMFVEVNYEYRPVVSGKWLPSSSGHVHYTASFIVRDRRIFDQIYNPSPEATRMTCNKHTD